MYAISIFDIFFKAITLKLERMFDELITFTCCIFWVELQLMKLASACVIWGNFTHQSRKSTSLSS